MTTISKLRQILLVTGLMTTQTIGWGTTFSQVGILATPIVDDIGLLRWQVFLGATVLYAFASLTAVYAGKLADKVGGLALLIPGSVVLGLSLWLLSAATGLWGYLLPWALMGCVFHVGLVTSAYTGLAQVLGRNASWAISTLTIATGLCSTIFWPLTEWLLGQTDWRGVLQIYAAITVLGCLPIHILLCLLFGHMRAGKGKDAPEPAFPHVRQGSERPAQALMITIACFGSLLGVGFGVAAIEIFTALGTPRTEAVYAGSLIGIAYLVSRVLALFLERWSTPARIARITYAALPLSLTPLLFYAFTGQALPSFVAAFVAFAFGMPAGLVGLLRSLFPLFLFGSDAYGARLGVQARATEAASALAPFGFTWALGYSATGLLSGLFGLGVFAFLGAVRLAQMTGPERKSEKA